LARAAESLSETGAPAFADANGIFAGISENSPRSKLVGATS
jgi:hypothetical protein